MVERHVGQVVAVLHHPLGRHEAVVVGVSTTSDVPVWISVVVGVREVARIVGELLPIHIVLELGLFSQLRGHLALHLVLNDADHLASERLGQVLDLELSSGRNLIVNIRVRDVATDLLGWQSILLHRSSLGLLWRNRLNVLFLELLLVGEGLLLMGARKLLRGWALLILCLQVVDILQLLDVQSDPLPLVPGLDVVWEAICFLKLFLHDVRVQLILLDQSSQLLDSRRVAFLRASGDGGHKSSLVLKQSQEVAPDVLLLGLLAENDEHAFGNLDNRRRRPVHLLDD